MRAVLLLNASFEPLQIIHWQRAIVLAFLNRVDVLEYYPDPIRGAAKDIPLPSVVRLRKYIHISSRPLRLSREHVFLRDHYTCQYCMEEFHSKELTLDHVHPVSRGGRKTWKNIVTACRPCNQKKGNKTPAEAHMNLAIDPVQPQHIHKKFGSPLTLYPESWYIYFTGRQREWMQRARKIKEKSTHARLGSSKSVSAGE